MGAQVRLTRHCRLRMRQRGVELAALREVLAEGAVRVAEEGRLLMTSMVSDVEAVVVVDPWGRRTVLTVRRRTPPPTWRSAGPSTGGTRGGATAEAPFRRLVVGAGVRLGAASGP